MRRFLLALLLSLLGSPLLAQSHPVFFNRASDTARWATWKTNYEANPTTPTQLGGQIYKYLLHVWNGGTGTFYGDQGQYGALLYHISGDAGYIPQSWARINYWLIGQPDNCGALGGNNIREFGWQSVLMYDWLYTGLTADQRTAYLNKINTMLTCSVFSGGDSDQTVGQYMSVAMWYLSTGSYNSTAGTLWNSGSLKFGGYTSTAADQTNHRNAIRYYAETLGAGGMWPESTDYNLGTVKIACLAAEALRSAQVPTDNYPELTTFCGNAALASIHEITPGLDYLASRVYKWGDNESLDAMGHFYRLETAMALAGLNVGKTNGPIMQDFVLRYLESAGGGYNALVTLGGTTGMFPRGFLMFDPAATRGDMTTATKSYYASGTGVAVARTGWTLSDALFGAQFIPSAVYNIQHTPSTFGQFQVWDGAASAWPIDVARTYMGVGNDPRGTNGVSLRGIPTAITAPIKEYHGNTQFDSDETNGFVYLAGTQGGAVTTSPYFNAPRTIVEEHSRSLVWVPTLKSVIVFDRTNAKSDSDGGCATGLLAAFQTWINSRPRKELYMYSRVSPTLGSGYTEWAYSGANKIRVDHLLPASITRTIDDLSAIWITGYYSLGSIAASEKKYNTRVLPAVDQKWDTFLNVWNYYGTGTPATTTLVQDTTNKVDAALVTSGSTNYLFAFNAIQGADIPDMTKAGCPGAGNATYSGQAAGVLGTVRNRTAGFTLTFTGPAGGTKAVLFDLDTGTAWQYAVNGGAPTDLTPDAKGVGVVNIAATGAVTLAITSNGSLPTEIQTGSLPNGRKGAAYSQALTAINGDGGPYTWSKTVGNLPSQLSLSAGGVISGTPDTAETQTFTLRAVDGHSSSATRAFTITIQDLPAITSISPGNGNVGSAYTYNLVSTGGTAPYSYAVTSGTLCDGLALSAAGAFTGIPTTVQSCAFTVTVTDAGALTGTAELGIQILSALPSLSVQASASAAAVVIRYGIAGLDASDDCTINLVVGDTLQQTTTSTAGASRRTAYFSSLTPDTTYGVDATCGTATAPRSYFRTSLASPGGTVSWKYSATPSAGLLARGVTKLRVSYNLPGEAADTVTAACTSRCTVTLPLTSGAVYELSHAWLSAADAVIASSAAYPVAVP